MSDVSRLTGSAIYLVAGGLLGAGGTAIIARLTQGPGAVLDPSMIGFGVGWVVLLSLGYGLISPARDRGRPVVVLTVGAAAAGVATGIGAWWVSEALSLHPSIGIPVALLALVLGVAVLVFAERWMRGGRHQAHSDHQLEHSPRS